MKRIIGILSLLLLAMLTFTGCTSDDNETYMEIGELQIPEDFTWDNIIDATVDVTLHGYSGDNLRVELLDGAGGVVSAVIAKESSVTLHGRHSNLAGDLSILIPKYNLEKKLDGLGPDYKIDVYLSNIEDRTVSNLLNNPGFENGNLTMAPANYVPPIDGNWYYTHQNYTHDFNLIESYGNTYLSYPKKGYLYQSVAVGGGSEGTFNFDINNPQNSYFALQIHLTCYADNGAMTWDNYVWIDSYWHGIWDYWQNISRDITIPEGTTKVTLTMYSNSNDSAFWIDNIGIYGVGAILDSDGDGVSDEDDDYPNDSDKSIKIVYPTQGKLIVAFEDLWPDTGDYDFNDLVLGITQEFGLNANNEYTYLKTDLEVRGNGATLNNVLEMKLDWAENSGNSSLYSPVENPNIQLVSTNTNSFIHDDVVTVIDGMLDSLSPYYQNNGIGISAPYQNFSFEITMDPISNSQATLSSDFFIHDFYHPEREIHLPGRHATSFADTQLFGTGNDSTIPVDDRWYLTDENLPWGFEIIDYTGNYMHPIENISILQAYREFGNWANSGGLSNLDWFTKPSNTSVFHPSF